MILSHFAHGKKYVISVPEGTKISLKSHKGLPDLLKVPYEGQLVSLSASPRSCSPSWPNTQKYGLRILRVEEIS